MLRINTDYNKYYYSTNGQIVKVIGGDTLRYLFFFIVTFFATYLIFETNIVKPLLYTVMITIFVFIINFFENKNNN